jgi:hypothetical protein
MYLFFIIIAGLFIPTIVGYVSIFLCQKFEIFCKLTQKYLITVWVFYIIIIFLLSLFRGYNFPVSIGYALGSVIYINIYASLSAFFYWIINRGKYSDYVHLSGPLLFIYVLLVIMSFKN